MSKRDPALGPEDVGIERAQARDPCKLAWSRLTNLRKGFDPSGGGPEGSLGLSACARSRRLRRPDVAPDSVPVPPVASARRPDPCRPPAAGDALHVRVRRIDHPGAVRVPAISNRTRPSRRRTHIPCRAQSPCRTTEATRRWTPSSIGASSPSRADSNRRRRDSPGVCAERDRSRLAEILGAIAPTAIAVTWS